METIKLSHFVVCVWFSSKHIRETQINPYSKQSSQKAQPPSKQVIWGLGLGEIRYLFLLQHLPKLI